MDLAQLTAEMQRFVDSRGWSSDGTPKPQTQRNLAISLVLEASEVLELFQWVETPEAASELASELADVALYLLQLASVSGIDLERAVLEKLKMNYGREW
ncbi:MAG: nucleotide pyrophosphohydrolase [Chloroflexi bacterium RBG_19FT_COMBO_62_14]|nr:MAG: nucleotide pyrophosphohydrolase [Chloroflexi bacterium RBG_19FT_COMBO_62_14]